MVRASAKVTIECEYEVMYDLDRMTLSEWPPYRLSRTQDFLKSNMSKTVQDRAIVTTEHKQEFVYELSNGVSYLERPFTCVSS